MCNTNNCEMQKPITFLCLLQINIAFAQLYDKTWICGSYGGKVVFNTGQIDTESFSPRIYSRSQWACISDNTGNFQFFTEGVNVYSNDGTQMVNGSGLADNSINTNFPSGLPDYQNVIILPRKGSEY